MKTVFKYHVAPLIQTQIPIPRTGRFLYFDIQEGSPTVWFEVDQYAPKDRRALHIYGTGHDIPNDSKHLASCIDGEFVWHLYEDNI